MAGLLVGALVFAAAPAVAQASASTPDKWTFTASPYVWFSGLSGDVSNPSGGEDFSADFGDIFATLKLAWMSLLEVRRGRLSALVDTMYLNKQQGDAIPGRGSFCGASASVKSAQAGAICLYTVAEKRAWRRELGGGVPAWWFNSVLKLDPGILPGRTVGNTTSWVGPVLPTRGVPPRSRRLRPSQQDGDGNCRDCDNLRDAQPDWHAGQRLKGRRRGRRRRRMQGRGIDAV
jgi:hypothetical protein